MMLKINKDKMSGLGMGKKCLSLLGAGVFAAASAWAYQSPDAFIKEADAYLSMKQMSRLLDREDAIEVARLAQEEDMDLSDNYLISDKMLRMMKRSGLMNTEFGRLMEEFQAECDRLTGEERAEAMSAWRALWLDKSFAYLKYIKSLKPVWGADLVQSLDYNSNASLRDPDDPSSSSLLGMRDVGLMVDGGLRYSPTINREKKLGWGYTAKVNAMKQVQASEDSLEFETLSMNHGGRWMSPFKHIRKISLDWNFLRSYSKNPANERSDYGRHSLRLSLVSDVQEMKGRWATGYFHSASVQRRWKDEYPDLGVGVLQNDVDTTVLNYGMTYMRMSESVPFQTLSWGLTYENQSVSATSSRSYDSWGLNLGYTRGLDDLYAKHNLNMSSSLSYRVKDVDGSLASSLDKENQLLASVALNATWSAGWSSSLSLSYLNKDKDLVAGGAVSSQSVDQWRVAWTNILSTF